MRSVDHVKVTHRQLAAAGAVLLFALALRLWGMAGESLWYDEIASYQFLGAPSLAEFLRDLRVWDPAMVPGYYAAEYYWARFFGSGELTVRLLSVLLSLGAGVFLYAAARRIASHSAAMVALLLFAASNLHIFYAQEIRNYAFTGFTAALCVYVFVRLLERPNALRALASVAASALLLSGHLFTVFVPIALAPILLLRTRRLGVLAIWFAGHAFLALVLAWWAAGIRNESIAGVLSWIPLPTPSGFAEVIAWPEVYLPKVSGMPLLALVFLGAALWCVACEARDRPLPSDAVSPWLYICLLLSWLVVPAAGLVAGSFLRQPMLVDRYLLHTSFALLILLGWAVSTLSMRGRAIAFGLVVLLCVLQIAGRPPHFRSDYRGFAAWLDEVAPQQGVSLVRGYAVQEREMEFHLGNRRANLTYEPEAASLAEAVARVAQSGTGPVALLVWEPLPAKERDEIKAAGLRVAAERAFPALYPRFGYLFTRQ